MRVLVLPLLLTAATAPPPASAPVSALAFFEGRTEGRGQLRQMMAGTSNVRVLGLGRITPDGLLILAQTVEREGKPMERREWRVRETAPGRYAGTLSDAKGPVTGSGDGKRFSLRYRTKDGLNVVQDMVLAPDKRSAHNILKIRKFGITVATLDETIRKID